MSMDILRQAHMVLRFSNHLCLCQHAAGHFALLLLLLLLLLLARAPSLRAGSGPLPYSFLAVQM